MILATLRKELAVVWASPVPWIGGALFHLLWGALYVTELEARRQALFQPAVPIAAFLVLVLLPLIAMRTFAEEVRQGTLDVLLATPVGAGRLVLGKWLAVLTTATLILLPVAAPLVVIERLGDLDPGGVIAASLGLLLFASAVGALAVFVSALTSSQPMAGGAAFLLGLMLWFAAATPGSAGAGNLLARISVSERLATFAAGGIDTGDATYFAVLAATALVLASVAVAERRARPRAGTLLIARVGAVVGAMSMVVIAGAVVATADANRRLVDLTTGSALTLSDTTQAVVRSVGEEVEVTAFLSRDDPARVTVSSLLARYRRINPRLTFTVEDPSSATPELRRLGVDPVFGGIVVRRGSRLELAATPTEHDITSALARVVRDDVPQVCVSTGHGEASLGQTTDAGLSQLSEALGKSGHDVRSINLLSTPSVPRACTVVLLAGPVTSFSEEATAEMSAWLEADGRALVLTDPAGDLEWDGLLSGFGIAVDRGIVFEADADHRFPGDPTRPIVLEYRTANPIGRRLPPTFYPGAQALVVAADPPTGVAVEPVARTTERSFLEREPLTPRFDEGIDRRGPITVVAAADRSENTGAEVVRSRVVVVADADIATNAFVGEAGNAQLLLRSVAWLVEDGDLVSVEANLAPLRPLELTAGRVRYLRMLTMGVAPALFLLLGALGWLLRRAR